MAHLKIRLAAAGRVITASLTANRTHPLLIGDVAGEPRDAALMINARVRLDPQQLRSIVEKCLQASAGGRMEIAVEQIRSFTRRARSLRTVSVTWCRHRKSVGHCRDRPDAAKWSRSSK